jgi:hypothetical protein
VAGKEALQLGLIKRIGDGRSVYVWNDNWIPRVRTMQPSAQLENDNGVQDNISLVSDLIDHDIGSWKIDMVGMNFITLEADAILNIPLRRGG